MVAAKTSVWAAAVKAAAADCKPSDARQVFVCHRSAACPLIDCYPSAVRLLSAVRTWLSCIHLREQNSNLPSAQSTVQQSASHNTAVYNFGEHNNAVKG